MKKAVILIIVLLTIIIFNIPKTSKLKKEYELLNNKGYIKVSIPDDSSLVYLNYKEISRVLDETGVIYIGSAKSQISRDYLNQLIKATEDTGIKKVYYLDIKKISKKENKKIIEKINNSKTENDKIEKIYTPTLITIKNGKIREIISENGEISNKKYKTNANKQRKILKEYTEAINATIMCSSNSEEQC